MTLARLLPRGNITGSLYGIVLVTSILVTFAGTDRVGYIIAGVVVTAGVFALAHAWAHALGGTLATRAPVDRKALRHSLRREWTIVEAAAPSTAVLTLAALGVYSAATGLWIAVLLNVALMFVWGAGLRELSGGNAVQVLGAGFASASLGFLLVLLKIIVH
jgi:hypothetical protein